MTLPSIPDNSYKFLLYIGLICIGYSFIQSLESAKTYNEQVKALNSNIDSLTLKEIFQKKEKEKLNKLANDLSTRYNIQNPITDTGATTYFKITYQGKKEEVLVSDSLQNIWIEYKNGDFEIDIMNEKIRMTKDNLNNADEEYNEINYLYITLAILGFLLSIAGYNGLERYQRLQEKLVNLDISQKDVKYKHCQSCGKTFSSLIVNGRDVDGKTNTAFCVNCYDSGKFLEPDLSYDEFKERTKDAIACKNSKKDKEELAKRFQNLERWKQNHYD